MSMVAGYASENAIYEGASLSSQLSSFSFGRAYLNTYKITFKLQETWK